MADAFHMLLVRFRRRLVAARAMRLLGMAALLVAAACLAGAMVQRMSGADLMGRSALAAAIAAAVAAILRLRHMPTLAAAALEIDRQRGFRELLSSAVLVEHDEDLGGCVVIAARQKAAEVDVTRLSVGGLGTPMWIAALLIAGFLPLAYRPAAVTPSAPTEGIMDGEISPERQSGGTIASARSEAPRLTREAQTPGASAITVAGTPEPERTSLAGRRPTRSDTAGASAGGGLAQGNARASPAPAPALSSAAGNTGGDTEPGSGRAQVKPNGGDTGMGVVASAGAQGNTHASASPNSQGQGPIDAQSFPEAYRDVLKAYFAR